MRSTASVRRRTPSHHDEFYCTVPSNELYDGGSRSRRIVDHTSAPPSLPPSGTGGRPLAPERVHAAEHGCAEK
jgi:hypothetical protein